MRKLQWGRLFSLIAVAVVVLGLGFLFKQILPEYIPSLQTDGWYIFGTILYYLGLIFLVLLVMVFIIILITGSKSKSQKKSIVAVDNQIYHEKALKFVAALGGAVNINSVEACMSRLRITLFDTDEINQNQIQELGATGIFLSGNQVQAIFGEESEALKNQIDEILKKRN